MAEHPAYPNPVVQELLCDITFDLQPDTKWNDMWFGDFYNRVRDRYPGFVPVMANVNALPDDIVPTALPIIRYSSSDGKRYLHLTSNKLLLNILAPYPGWNVVRQEIQDVLAVALSVIKPAKITNLGLRYINRIERTRPEETLGEWLVSTDYIPKSVLQSRSGFMSVVQVLLEESSSLVVATGELNIPEADAARSISGLPFTLDIDRSVAGKELGNIDEVVREADRMHDDVWKVFDAATGKKLKKLLMGELLR